MITRLSAVVAVVALMVIPATAPAQQDLSGVRAFWSVVDQLSAGLEPHDASWDSLFATPGYAALQARERRRPALTNGIRLALHPALTAQRDSALQLANWTARVIRHIRDVVANRAALDSFAADIATRDLLARSIELALTLLPRDAAQRFGTPRVAYVFFLPDGRGYPDLIVADLANVMRKSDPEGFFAHEATHFYYAHFARARSAEESAWSGATRSLASLLTKLHEESLGDQHDKLPLLDPQSATLTPLHGDSSWRAYMTDYRSHYGAAPGKLRELFVTIEGALTDSARGAERIDSIASSLPLEGRPIGAFMTAAIRRVTGDGRIRDTVGNPFAWLLAFERASHDPRCRCPLLPPGLAAYLRTASKL